MFFTPFSYWKTVSTYTGTTAYYIGGPFYNYSGSAAYSIARLNTDGRKDTTFNSILGFGNTVYSLAIQSDQKILMGGTFSYYGGSVTNNIARLNTDGTQDFTFKTGGGFNASVNNLAIQSDQKIIAASTFTTYSGSSANGIARLNLDGTLDATFVTGSGFLGYARFIGGLGIQSNQKIVVGGDFSEYSGSHSRRIARINTDGTFDSTFNTGAIYNTSGFSDVVYSLAIQSDQKIIVGGNFLSYAGSYSQFLARLNTDGTLDNTFSTDIDGPVLTLAIQSDQKIIVGGGFNTYSGVTTHNIVRLNINGTIDTTFNTGGGFSNSVSALALQSDQKILVGGSFTTYSGSAISYLARVNTDGTLDTTFNTGTGPDDAVYAITLY